MLDAKPHRFPSEFPPSFASAWGDDRYGLWAEFEVAGNQGGVTQRCRWIEPGTFLMGSPESEPERLNDENLHEVTFTQGYWLADTACTQKLWLAVMGYNASEFLNNLENPVERVSEGALRVFLIKLNALVPGLYAGLPSDAQWEYACRAGTRTPFSFGDNITPNQVNYDGNLPYVGGQKGEYRNKTVPVKSLPANDWGLYEMHGNVWELCTDGYSPYYSADPQINPLGSSESVLHVLRGGSWIGHARDCRSALRYRIGFMNMYSSDGMRLMGFRLAPGQGNGTVPIRAASGAERIVSQST